MHIIPEWIKVMIDIFFFVITHRAIVVSGIIIELRTHQFTFQILYIHYTRYITCASLGRVDRY